MKYFIIRNGEYAYRTKSAALRAAKEAVEMYGGTLLIAKSITTVAKAPIFVKKMYKGKPTYVIPQGPIKYKPLSVKELA